MPSIFKNVRRFLLHRGRVGRYLLYAIGEIILVVIGILIALQINNYNEVQKNDAKVKTLLRKVQRDIKLDMANVIDIMPFYVEKDSLGRLVIEDKLTRADYTYSGSDGLHELVFNLEPLNLKRGGYDNLMKVQDIIPTQYDTVMELLKVQYDEHYKVVNKTHDFLIITVQNNADYLFTNYEWYSQTGPYELNDEAIDYFLGNIRYKGMVQRYLDASTADHVHQIINYINVAINSFDLIDSLIGVGREVKRPYDLTRLDPKYLGRYSLKNNDTIEVLKQDNFYYILGNNKTRLLPYKKNAFFTTNGFLRFDQSLDSVHLFVNRYENGKIPFGTKID